MSAPLGCTDEAGLNHHYPVLPRKKMATWSAVERRHTRMLEDPKPLHGLRGPATYVLPAAFGAHPLLCVRSCLIKVKLEDFFYMAPVVCEEGEQSLPNSEAPSMRIEETKVNESCTNATLTPITHPIVGKMKKMYSKCGVPNVSSRETVLPPPSGAHRTAIEDGLEARPSRM
ncbi:hypothetical protein NDU88_007603 [Pleurodeles waltl]|uniref:Uncharacterized protein n=1 Tax=Pleurodeles waltl TaxID=8319 RepID=A0AAV7RS83_PLEWA|nr:hypothetical protein NDU88_007603 [Pleurodeles waltl]